MNDIYQIIADELQGTCHSISYIIDKYELDESVDIEDTLLDFNIERCLGCGWWQESCELDGQNDRGEIVDENIGYCQECAKYNRIGCWTHKQKG